MIGSLRRLVGRGGRATRPTDPDDGDAYNYRHFRFETYGPGVRRSVRAGDPAPDGTVYRLAGEPVALADYWSERPAVIEFGSLTCPAFVGNVAAMNDLARRYATEVDVCVVYVREAHPGRRLAPRDGALPNPDPAGAVAVTGVADPGATSDVTAP